MSPTHFLLPRAQCCHILVLDHEPHPPSSPMGQPASTHLLLLWASQLLPTFFSRGSAPSTHLLLPWASQLLPTYFSCGPASFYPPSSPVVQSLLPTFFSHGPASFYPPSSPVVQHLLPTFFSRGPSAAASLYSIIVCRVLGSWKVLRATLCQSAGCCGGGGGSGGREGSVKLGGLLSGHCSASCHQPVPSSVVHQGVGVKFSIPPASSPTTAQNHLPS